ncbi:DoxX family protein [Peribacillus frigoritolerans]|uniref:DoxX family protein n=1 Tax=Peribacillus frigoritolerans TaxID=450367 RepID=UPI00105A1B3C|nr:DoxX family protein [Peribacillus frigoritolerans]TDL80551.1 DoxX family protein [Peribacillus frigoritolerans]
MAWFRGTKMAVVWTVLRIWLGIQWFEAGIGKITGGFDATGYLQGAIVKAGGDHPAVQGWYAAFLKHAALPNAELINVLVPWGEALVGIALIVGLATLPALLAGAFMNLNFMLAGTTSTNPILYTAAMILMAAGAVTWFYGADRFVIPYIKNNLNRKQGLKKTKQHHAAAH